MTKTERLAKLESDFETMETFVTRLGVELAELRKAVAVLEASVERIDSDRKTFVRHQQTAARNVRKLIAENRAFRAAIRRECAQAGPAAGSVTFVSPDTDLGKMLAAGASK